MRILIIHEMDTGYVSTEQETKTLVVNKSKATAQKGTLDYTPDTLSGIIREWAEGKGGKDETGND